MLVPASPAASAEKAFSAPICASTALASVIEEAAPDGRPSQFDNWPEAAFITEISPPPPQNAPVLRSITSGQLEKIIG